MVQSLCPAASPPAFPAGNALLTIPYIFMAISPSGLEISFKNFFKIFIFQGNLLSKGAFFVPEIRSYCARFAFTLAIDTLGEKGFSMSLFGIVYPLKTSL